MNAPLTDFLTRLDNVHERSGGQYRADCPVGHKSRGALSVSEGDDGTVLMHCFAGCDIDAVTGAVGMRPSDLFAGHQHTGMARRPGRVGPDWKALAKRMSMELTVLEVGLASFEQHGQLSADDWERIRVALERLSAFRGRYYGHG